jgi:hypothetical protein
MQPFPSFGNTAQFMFSISCPFKELGTVALTLNSYWMDAQLRTGSWGPDTYGILEEPKLFKPSNYQIKASYSNALSGNVSIGLSASILRIVLSSSGTESEQGNGEVSTILLDAGVLVKDLFNMATYQSKADTLDNITNDNIHPGISVGFSLLNFGPKIYYIDNAQKDPSPSIALLGFVYTPIITSTISARILMDFEKRIYDSNKLDYIHSGAEFILYKMFSLRGGYAANIISPELSYPTFGIGINYKFIYANVSRYKKYLLPTWQFDTKISLEL